MTEHTNETSPTPDAQPAPEAQPAADTQSAPVSRVTRPAGPADVLLVGSVIG